jgi:hypothetical protein
MWPLLGVKAPTIVEFPPSTRLQRIRMRGNSSIALWIFVAVVLFVLCVALPWLILHTHPDPTLGADERRARERQLTASRADRARTAPGCG